MPLEINFELSDEDLEFLKSKALAAAEQAMKQSEEALLAATKDAFKNMKKGETPGFVSERADKLQMMIDMLEDTKWRMTGEDRERVLKAIAYFAEPEDLIPDSIPGLGFLDDAIMIELIVRELKHEIEAYQDFLSALAKGRVEESKDGQMTSEEWVEHKRLEMQERMERRRRRRRRGGAGPEPKHSPFALY